jgi:hypothetical protein
VVSRSMSSSAASVSPRRMWMRSILTVGFSCKMETSVGSPRHCGQGKLKIREGARGEGGGEAGEGHRLLAPFSGRRYPGASVETECAGSPSLPHEDRQGGAIAPLRAYCRR